MLPARPFWSRIPGPTRFAFAFLRRPAPPFGRMCRFLFPLKGTGRAGKRWIAMATKPLIGINGDFRPARKDATSLSWFNTGYYDSITAAKIKIGPKESDVTNAIPILIPPLAEDSELKQMLGMLDGVVLAGC